MQPVENKIISRIHGRGKGWAFTKSDFVRDFDDNNIYKALSHLTEQEKIRRVLRGVYDYPKYSEFLGQRLSPDIDQVAQALARKHNWRIAPSGNIALNLLGLSTQVPAHWIYLSDGPSKHYELGKQTLRFKKSALREIGFQYPESRMLVQALKALGKEAISREIIEGIRRQWNAQTRKRILEDTKATTAWVYRVIKQICREPTLDEILNTQKSRQDEINGIFR